MLKENDDLEWYARKARVLREDAPPEPAVLPQIGVEQRVTALLAELRSCGIKGSVEDRTLYTRRLPPGCRGCLGGKGSNLYITGRCTRDCDFCFNTTPRTDETVVHGIKISDPKEAGEIVKRYGLRSIGISGGEPLMYPDRVLSIIRVLRELPERVRIDLYTNGDRASDEVLGRLKEAGLDAMRFNLVANEFDTRPVERALNYFDEIAVEIPVVPSKMRKLEDMVMKLDGLGVPFLNIHELFSCAENRGRVSKEGPETRTRRGDDTKLMWRPVSGGEEAALRLLLFALKFTDHISTYYCSCSTQELISRRGFARRVRTSGI